MKKKIVVPTDLSSTADHAIQQAASIARKAMATLVLLHVQENNSIAVSEIETKLNAQAFDIWEKSGLECEVIIREGPVSEVVTHAVRENDFDFMVIGTHNIKGIRQMLAGSDILKLVSKVSVPVLVVQEKAALVEDFRRIILPVSSHESIQPAIDAMLFFTGIYNTGIDLYSVYKPGFEWPKQLLLNIDETIKEFEAKGVQFRRIKEDQNSYSMGYAKQTIKYAESVHADAICVMSLPSKEYYYFAQSDKESLLQNEFNIPVLCVGGGY